MFIRIKNKPSKTHAFNKSVQIVESVRMGKKVKQKILQHLGVAHSEEQLKQLKSLALIRKQELENGPQCTFFDADDQTQIKPHSTTNPIPPAQESTTSKSKKTDTTTDADYQIDIRGLQEQGRIINGIHDIYGKLFDQLGLNQVIAQPSHNKSALRIFKQIVLARIANPQSKKATVQNLEEQFGQSLNLDQVYRMMDKLDDAAIERLNRISFEQAQKLFPEPIDVIFYDATTLYFESFEEDELKRNGYSKDLKFNQPQVLLALMVTKQGLPIGYQIYPGDTFEGHTLIPALEQLKTQFQVDKVVYVADSGLFNQNNLQALEAKGFNYLVGARIKNLPQSITKQILNPDNYTPLAGNTGIQVARFEHQGRTILVSYSPKRARKDKADREKGIAKLQAKLNAQSAPKAYLSTQGYHRFLQLDGECSAKVMINPEKVEQAQAWDGLKGIILPKGCHLTDQEILTHYNNLWQIEQSFRITKHDLRIRPIFHWKPQRVKAHLAISFAAYMLTRHLEYRVSTQFKVLSPERIRHILLSVQTSIYDYPEKKHRYAIPSTLSNEAKGIYRLMSVVRPTCAYLLEKYEK